MVLAQGLLEDLQGAPVKRLGLRVAALVAVEIPQVVERRDDFGMVVPERLLPDPQGAPEKRLGLPLPGTMT